MNLTALFFILALVSAAFGFGGIAAGFVGVGKTMFFVFAVLAVLSFLYEVIRNSPPSDLIHIQPNHTPKDPT